jgi:sulfur carrier protein
MNLTVNGEAATWEDDATLEALVRTFAGTKRGVAVSVDRVVVPRSAWSSTTLADGASVEVLVAAAGG